MARIAIVGDVHDLWETALDAKALSVLKPDLVLFVGDFGDEKLQLVRDVSKLEMPKAVILGNHDCWWDGMRNEVHPVTSYRIPTSVSEQLAALGDTHIGYNRMNLPELKLSVIGVRPFSIGGNEIFNKPLVNHLYGISDFEKSVKKIVSLALEGPEDHSLIFLGHNGPTGLGSLPNDLCGRDFEPGGGDHGDPDLEEALKVVRANRNIPLVAFGHMHQQLIGRRAGKRKMVATGRNGTTYVNSAVVPRVVSGKRNFTLVDLSRDGTKVTKVKEVWVAVTDEHDDHVKVVEEKVLYKS